MSVLGPDGTSGALEQRCTFYRDQARGPPVSRPAFLDNACLRGRSDPKSTDRRNHGLNAVGSALSPTCPRTLQYRGGMRVPIGCLEATRPVHLAVRRVRRATSPHAIAGATTQSFQETRLSARHPRQGRRHCIVQNASMRKAAISGIVGSKRWFRGVLELSLAEWRRTVRLHAEIDLRQRRSRGGSVSASRSSLREPAARPSAPWFYRTHGHRYRL